MGTVPDPLRSAKLSLVTAFEENDQVGDLQSAKHQPKQPSQATASNGLPHTVSDSAGVCSFDLKYTTAADGQTCEKRPGDDARRQGTLSPGLLDKASEGHPAGVESAGNLHTKGSEEPAAQGRPAQGACGAGPRPAVMPAPQNSRQFVQSSPASSSSLAQMDDSALKPQGTDDQPALEVLSCSSPSTPVRGNESFHAPQENVLQREEKEKAAEKNAPAVCWSASLARDTEGDVRRGPQVALEAEHRAADAVQSGPADASAVAQGSTSPAQLRLESAQPVCSAGLSQLSRFRETGTMTVQTENSSLTQEAANRTWRDAEVQAVACVESKSACTSPSILSAFLKGNPRLEEKEELHIIYQGTGGLSQTELIDSLSSHPKSPCSSGIMSEPTVVTAVTNTAQTPAVKLQEHPGDPSATMHPASADNAAPGLPCPPTAITSPGPSMASAQTVRAARDGRDAAPVPLDAPALPKAMPADQPAVHTSYQMPSQPGCGEPNTVSAAAGPETKSNVHLVPDAGNSQLPLPGSTHGEIKQKDVLGSSEQKPRQCKGGNEVETLPVPSMVKPKEENLAVLGPKGVTNVSGEPAANSIKASSEDTGEKGHGAEQGEISQALESSGRSSTHVPPLAEASAAPQQQRLRAKESRRELDAAALPASAQALPNLGESKKQPTPATEAKVQVKQSKHVRDVVWDEQGMTWEVYGASLDPESLGIAIQNHLQRQIREHEKLIRAQNTQNRKSISSDTSSNKKLKGRQHNVFQSMLQNFRRPNCCVRPAPSSVLD
ncbi:PREDICTED: G protein-regulated inducer of neurite outgrowth 3 [Tinamus guttatus]|uniref:G protein-regulated inducer of neurite outgrowth 3 n=1 Tax=Tinamus guttatus TaxID=94827 RepID=UPI00052EAD13|nr:PREDICTED: G protein-regulated inducer of neurite outgrowth 3 [Tinamus guttatus]